MIATNTRLRTSQRFVAYANHPDYGEMKMAKGLLDKVLSRKHPQPLAHAPTPAPTPTRKILDTGDDGGDMWICEDLAKLEPEIKQVDAEFSKNGFKVSLKAPKQTHTKFSLSKSLPFTHSLLTPESLQHSPTPCKFHSLADCRRRSRKDGEWKVEDAVCWDSAYDRSSTQGQNLHTLSWRCPTKPNIGTRATNRFRDKDLRLRIHVRAMGSKDLQAETA